MSVATERVPTLCIVGGFLGAGKTTALLRLADLYQADGRRVGLVTNDQADDLVDTGTVRVRGFRVEQVAGACFCCKFDELAGALERLRVEDRPDVLFGEPVGSCTDLAATVIAPFRELYGERYAVAPYSVLLDPVRARQILLERGFGGFSAKVAYIFQKQLEEANLVCISKCDLLSSDERERLAAAVTVNFPRARVLLTSALTGEGFDEWRALLESERDFENRIVAVDYDLYAQGEAELGWLNATFELHATRPFDANALVRDLIERLARRLAEEAGEVAHVKVLLEAQGGAALANVVRGGGPASVSQTLPAPVRSGRLLVNARVHADPDALAAHATACVGEVRARHGVEATPTQSAHFRPGRPVPTHRFGA